MIKIFQMENQRKLWPYEQLEKAPFKLGQWYLGHTIEYD